MATCPPYDFSAKYYDVDGGSGCERQSSFFGGTTVLDQGVGYAVILGFGAFFAIFTSFLWTWAATILQSSNVAWQYGVSGPFWYASGATIQVLLFGVMAIEIKRKAPNAHTVCEIVKARWGTATHIVFLVFCLATNVVVTAMLLLGGSAVVNALTGVNIYAASFLIPLGVVIYTLAGGLKATFLASYVHSVIGKGELGANWSFCWHLAREYRSIWGSIPPYRSILGRYFGLHQCIGWSYQPIRLGHQVFSFSSICPGKVGCVSIDMGVDTPSFSSYLLWLLRAWLGLFRSYSQWSSKLL